MIIHSWRGTARGSGGAAARRPFAFAVDGVECAERTPCGRSSAHTRRRLATARPRADRRGGPTAVSNEEVRNAAWDQLLIFEIHQKL
eukprot:6190594-Pleurochrysis_carterae.AAC.3